MLGRARRHRANHLIGIGIPNFNNRIGKDLLAANAHGFVANFNILCHGMWTFRI